MTRTLVLGQDRQILQATTPLFVSRFGNRLRALDVARICQRLSREASTHLPKEKQFRIAPHQLRHTFLKRCADKKGVHYAQEMSGNVSMKEVFRYTQPSDSEMEATAESVFD